MTGLGKIAVCLAGGLMLIVSARAGDVAAAGNPYAPIVVRNVFGLNPPSPEAPPPVGDPPPKITPNGIMTIFGQVQVLFKVAPVKPGPGAKEESYVLSEGQQQDDIEVTQINEKAGVITFNNHGTVQTLPLANTPALNTPTMTPGGGLTSGQNFPTPGGIPARFGGHPGGPTSLGGMRGRAPAGGGDNSNNGQGNIPGGGAPMNTFPNRGGYSGQQQQDPPLSSAEANMLMVAAQHLKAQQEGHISAPIFPPTPLDRDAGITGPPIP